MKSIYVQLRHNRPLARKHSPAILVKQRTLGAKVTLMIDVASIKFPTGIVIDFDGTLADTAPCWMRAVTAVFAKYGLIYTKTHQKQVAGRHPSAVGQLLGNLLGRPDLTSSLGDEVMQAGVLEVCRGVHSMPGAVRLLQLLSDRRIAVASNSPRSLLDLTLRNFGVMDAIDVIVGGDEVAQPKPAPDIYSVACARLGVAPNEAIAIEDSAAGVNSARSAGLYVVTVGSDDYAASLADNAFNSLDDSRLLKLLTGEALDQLFQTDVAPLSVR